jgi:hypothetical protein
MKPKPSLHRQKRRGSSAMEFALTFPAFIFIVAIFTDYGWVFFQKAMLDNAIHEGCRAGAVADPQNVDPHTVADDRIKDQLEAVGLPCSACVVTLEDRGAAPAISLFCQVQRPTTALWGFVPIPPNMSSSTLLRYEFQDDIAEMLAGG